MTPQIILDSWEEKLESPEKALRESLWGDFLIGGLLVSGIFIFIESLDLDTLISRYVGISLFGFTILLILLRIIYWKIKTNEIETGIKEAEKCRSEKNYNMALSCLNNLLENKRYRKLKEIWNNKAMTLYFLEMYEEALYCYNFALEIDPFYKFAINGRSIILYEMKRLKKALKGFQKAIALDQNFKEAWYNKGNVLIDLKRYEEALICYETTIKIDPKHKRAWYNKACIESLQGNKDSALLSLEKAINLDNKYKEKAKKDPDFDNIKNLSSFKLLTS